MNKIQKIIMCMVSIGMVCFASSAVKAICPPLILCPEPTAVTDPVSIMPQTLVQAIQGVLSTYTNVEKELQGKLKDLHFEPEFMGIKLTIEANNQMKPIAEGLLTADPVTKKYTGMSAKNLAADSQTILTTVAGTMEGIDQYIKSREYDEQEAAIEMLAAVLVLKKGTETVQELLREFDLGKYEKVDNYKLALEGNLAVSTMYNQMLSLEQQVTAMRLNTVSSQRMLQAQPITESLAK